MKGYPNHFNTKQDYLNILELPEYRSRCLEELRRIRDLKDDRILKATTTTQIDPENFESDWKMEEIKNPNPVWKQKGFASRQEVRNLIKNYE